MTLFASGIVHAQQPPPVGGGGGGGPVLIDEHICDGSETSVTLSGITSDFGALTLDGRCRLNMATGIDGKPVGMELNLTNGSPTFRWVLHRSGQYNGGALNSVEFSTAYPPSIAIAPGTDGASSHWCSFTHRILFPDYAFAIGAFDDLEYHLHGHSAYIIGNTYLQIQHFASWGIFPHETLSSLKLLAFEETTTFTAGSIFRLWGDPAS